jgi:site-specific DNA-methyltransferase (adenine-specific)
MIDTVIQGDCLEVMPGIPDKSIDMILCDLPYGTTACKWDQVIPFEPLWKEYKRLIKDHGAIVLTASQPFTSMLITSNLKWFRCEWIWQKSNGGGFLNANKYPLKRHENILVFSGSLPLYYPQKTKGKPYSCRSSSAGETTQDQTVAGWITDNSGDRFPTSVLIFSNETGLHPTQKPVALFEYLIKTYTNEGDLVLDNCIGSGTTAIAALNTGRHFIGIEKEPKYVEIARRRIAAIPKTLSHFAEKVTC